MLHSLLRRSRALWNNRQWRRLILVGTVAASAGVLLLGLIRGWPELARYQWQFDWRPLAVSGLMYAVALWLAVLAWTVIMRALQADFQLAAGCQVLPLLLDRAASAHAGAIYRQPHPSLRRDWRL